MYRIFYRPLLFLFDPESVHHFTFRVLRILYKLPFYPAWHRLLFRKKDPRLEQELFGLRFPNPVGLAAGFDKDGMLAEKWENLGFGFAEMGTVTPVGQEGNPRQRLFRLPADEGIINRMGFNNQGVEALVGRLKKMRKKGIVIGGNIGKNKITPNKEAFRDYEICFEALYPHVDYFVVNVSSPNTPNLRDLQEKEPLTDLLNRLQIMNRTKPAPKPILLKIAPDLTDGQLDDILEIVETTKLSGVVATNTTISRSDLQTPDSEVKAIGNGGLSGKPLTKRATEVIRYLSEKSRGKVPIIGVGGIMTPEDALEKLRAGACLVQVYSGFVYNGPAFARKINSHLLKNGFQNGLKS